MPLANFLRGNNAPPAALLENILRNFALSFEVMIPANVVSYDRAKNIVTVQPAINRVNTANESIKRALLILPVFNPAGMGVGINFPLQKGDTGWVIACDRNAETFIETLEQSDPHTLDAHRYAFGFFIPDKIHGFVINPEDDGALVIETLDGKTRISIKDGQVTIASTENVKVSSKTATVSVSDSATVSCPETTWTGNITVDGDVIAKGVSLVNHVHPYSNGTTGKPQGS